MNNTVIQKAAKGYWKYLKAITIAAAASLAFVAVFITFAFLPWIVAYLGWGISVFSNVELENLGVSIVWMAWVVFVVFPAFLAFSSYMDQAGDDRGK